MLTAGENNNSSDRNSYKLPINKWATSLGEHINLETTADVQLQNLRKGEVNT